MNYPIKKLDQSDIILKDWEYEFQQRGEQPILLSDYFVRSLEKNLSTSLGGATRHENYLFTDSSKGYCFPRLRQELHSFIKGKALDRNDLKKILKCSITVPQAFNVLGDEICEKLSVGSISNEILALDWEKMDKEILRVIPWFYYPWVVSKENYLTDRIKEKLEKYRDQIEQKVAFDEALLLLVFPTKKTNFQLEQDELFGLVLLAEQDIHFEKSVLFREKAAGYLKKYDWLTTFIFSPILPMTYAQLVERVNRAQSENFSETLALQKEALQKSQAQAKELLTIVESDEELSRDIADARELGYVLTAGIEESYKSSTRYLGFMQLVAKRIGIAFPDLKYLLSKEIYQALVSGETIPAALVAERRKGFVLMMLEGEEYLATGESGHRLSGWIDRELNRVDTSVQELQGTVACRGKTRGEVRVALTPGDAHALVTGEVLVTPMTNPDYVSAMRRSVAIVTDEGGLLCHAAIMSREFGKPCIIGTKIASRVLKNGDLVEVDAENGVVQILERNK